MIMVVKLESLINMQRVMENANNPTQLERNNMDENKQGNLKRGCVLPEP
jgi:hypothetical protein